MGTESDDRVCSFPTLNNQIPAPPYATGVWRRTAFQESLDDSSLNHLAISRGLRFALESAISSPICNYTPIDVWPCLQDVAPNMFEEPPIREMVDIRESDFLSKKVIAWLDPVDATTHIACEVFLLCQDFVVNVQLLGQVCDRLIIESFIGLKAIEPAEKGAPDITRYDEEVSVHLTAYTSALLLRRQQNRRNERPQWMRLGGKEYLP